MKKKKVITKKTLNPRQELFCRYYTQNDALFCNATLSYAEAYGYQLETLSHEGVYEQQGAKTVLVEKSEYDNSYNICAVEGNRHLKNPNIQAKITDFLNEMLIDKVVDSHLSSLIIQNKDLPSKVAAIREYNKLRQRITGKHDITSGGNALPITAINVIPIENK